VYGKWKESVCILRVTKPGPRGPKQNAHMNKSNVVSIQTQALVVAEGRTNLEQLLREGAQRMLQKAIENEVQEFMQVHAGLRTEDDHQAVVRNGSMPTRQIVTGLGPLEVQQP
jgi:hypothetical protein